MMKRYLTETEQHKLLNSAKSRRDPLAQRDYWWMRLMILTGMRVTEFSQLTRAQAEAALQHGWLVVPKEQRKGGKLGNEYMVTEPVRACLDALVFMSRSESAGPEHAAPLVWGRDGAAMSVRSYQARLKVWVLEAGIDPRTSVHWLRHTCGMNVIRNSRSKNPLKVAQMALGHASIASTGIYTQMSREEYARDMQQIHGGRVSKAQARRMAAGVGA